MRMNYRMLKKTYEVANSYLMSYVLCLPSNVQRLVSNITHPKTKKPFGVNQRV
jgi:hypothetical protein